MQKNTWPFWAVGALATANTYFKGDPLNGCEIYASDVSVAFACVACLHLICHTYCN